MGASNAITPLNSKGLASPPILVPNLYLDSGRIVAPVSGQFERVMDMAGKPTDPFDVADRLVAKYQRFCVVDLEGHRQNRAQLEYLQELSRSGEMWVDAGIRMGDQVIDILVTGARRAILSTAFLLGPKELRRAWRLSTEVLFAVESNGEVVRPRGNSWDGQPAEKTVAEARTIGPVEVLLRSRHSPLDWSLVRRLSAQGPVWVEGEEQSSVISRLSSSGARGVLFDPPRTVLTGAEEAT